MECGPGGTAVDLDLARVDWKLKWAPKELSYWLHWLSDVAVRSGVVALGRAWSIVTVAGNICASSMPHHSVLAF